MNRSGLLAFALMTTLWTTRCRRSQFIGIELRERDGTAGRTHGETQARFALTYAEYPEARRWLREELDKLRDSRPD